MRILTCLLMSALVAACSATPTPSQPSPVVTMDPTTPSPAPLPAAPPTARYRVVFDSTWSAETHPSDFPASAHYSRLIGGTHSSAIAFWRDGELASEGMRRMAERGSISPLDAEISQAIAAGTAQHLLTGLALDVTPGAVEMEFEVSRDFPLITLVTMVAPSPDWFVGVSGVALLRSGAWVEALDVPLYAHDAGTDAGTTYTSPDRESVPREPITRLDGDPVATGGGVAPFGRFRFTRLP